jgi:hypothetical protein
VRIEIFGHERLKHSFSQVEGDLNFQEISRHAPLPKKNNNKEER